MNDITPTNALAFELKGSLSLGGAEISAFDPGSDRLYVTSNAGLQVVDLSNPAAPTLVGVIDLTTLGFATTDVTSVAIKNGVVAVALPNADKAAAGQVVFLNAANGTLLGSATVGALPDMLTFTPDGTKVLVANEGEVISDANFGGEGSVSIIDISGGFSAPTVTTAGFTAFNGQEAALRAEGVRIWAGKTVSEDVEPEYIAVSADGTKAMVTLQEANAVAILDIASATFTDIVPLGTKDFSTLMADFSDRDGAGNTTLKNLQTGAPVKGLYMPDAIDSYTSGGNTYYVIANEGDDRDDFLSADETIRVGSNNYDLDNATFPDEATLKTNAELARLTVSNAPGLRGDTDGDGDIDQILTYGARSFSILDANGNIVFDSGDMIERIIAEQFPSLFDDTRSDNKGPEPEGIEIAVIDGRTYAMVGLERSHLTLAFDVTDPANVTYTGAARRDGDLNPEGQLYISAEDSPTGQALLVTSNEVSNNISVFGIEKGYTLQILHASDFEGGVDALERAKNFAAIVDVLEDSYANSITLSSGDNFIPGPFTAAGTDPTVRDEIASFYEQYFGLASGSLTGIRSGTLPFNAADIAILNAIGVQASTIGNHEFDLGPNAFAAAFDFTATLPSLPGQPTLASITNIGALFPYLSANLNFGAESSLSGLYTAALQDALAYATTAAELATGEGIRAEATGREVAPWTTITEGGETIGILAATTQVLANISSVGRVTVSDPANDGGIDNMDELASILQPLLDQMTAAGINKIILMSHLQNIANERLLATKLSGVDVIIGGGSHVILADGDDTLAPGDTAGGTYPEFYTDAAGGTVALVNTGANYDYVGRLVIDFDAKGNIIRNSVQESVSGAYVTTDEGVDAVAGNGDGVLSQAEKDAIFADGTRGGEVKQITDAIADVVEAKDGEVWGYTNVYLEGDRAFGRTQEVNLGNITADANRFAALDALGGGLVGSLKNGGGIRAPIGTIEPDGTKTAPEANAAAGKPAGAISTLDIENALRFDNKLMVFDTDAAGLKAILEHAASLNPGSGGYMQLGGLRVSYDPDNATGSKVVNISVIDSRGNVVARVVEDGVVSADAPAVISMVTLNFTANGGDGYPIKANGSNFRYLLADGTLSAPVDEALDFTATANVPANALGEQQAFKDYLQANHRTPARAYDEADRPQAQDLRIENLNVRATDAVFQGIERDGGAAGERLDGTAGDDTLSGAGGSDSMRGLLGDDSLEGGSEGDLLDGGAGADTIDAGTGADRAYGGTGNDSILGGDGNDSAYGGAGADTIDGGDGADLLYGQDGADVLMGGEGADRLHGQAGTDSIRGGDGNDSAYGGADADTLDGGNDADLLLGEGGADLLLGGAGTDRLHGGSGNDTLVGGAGADAMVGDAGADVFRFLAYADSVTETDRIFDFSQAQGDRIDLSFIDADAVAAGDQAFVFGGASFVGGGVASIRVRDFGTITQVQVDDGSGGAAEMVIRLLGSHALTASDFIL
ncbi:bifunctional metallophosphatase/5'-nucleotidase [Roseomonas stagni]|uniref:Bifunctional metallophosphatase/5'-nucleotidase n=1 Tax=Falsiroseomonas algicola TaxID=2716930 RepID=A0A6M1LP61_9PROT|nr:choice-of-anchor I family protein [Falsiroseomonas algicola]NGM21574.1 bifunctional metallophosphatase/5'-nucleotidase [Falsiroseomonas algicola]